LKTSNFVTVLSRVALATLGMVFGLCLPSSAAQLWNWSYGGGGSIGGSGTFTTNDGPSPYLVTGITGTSEGQTITSLIPVGVHNSGRNDNLLYPNFPWFNQFKGVAFNTPNSGVPGLPLSGINFSFSAPDGNINLLERPGIFSYAISFTATRSQSPSTTPEPSSLLGFITLGGLMLGSSVRGARK